MYVVGWNIGSTTAWCRLTKDGIFVDWGECCNVHIDEVVSYLKREQSFVVSEIVTQTEYYRCTTCQSAINSVRAAWPEVVWVTRRQWNSSHCTEIPITQDTKSQIRRDAFYIAQFGVVKYNRRRRV